MLETCRDTILLNGFQQEISPDRSSSTETQESITFAAVNKKPGVSAPGLNAKDGEVNIPTLADLPFSRNAKELLLGEAAMPYNTDDLNFSFAAVPHQLISRFIGNKHRDILALIVFAFSKCQRRPHLAETEDGKMISLDPYEFIFGRYSWAEELEIHPSRIRRIIGQLIGQQFVTKVASKSTSKYTVYRWSTKRFCKNSGQQSDQHFGQQTGTESATNKRVRVKKDIIKKDAPEEKLSFGEDGNVKLTSKEHASLIAKNSSEDLAWMIDKLGAYIPNSKRPYASHASVLRKGGWVHDELLKHKLAGSPKAVARTASSQDSEKERCQILIDKIRRNYQVNEGFGQIEPISANGYPKAKISMTNRIGLEAFCKENGLL